MTEDGPIADPGETRRPRLPDVFPSLAFLFGPADPGVRSTVVEADPGWALPSTEADVDVVLWGHLARNARPSFAMVPSAIRREAAIARLRREPPTGLRLAELHRLPPVRRPGRFRGPIRAALLGGVLAELVRGERPARVIDAVVEAAGATSLGSGLRPSGNGSALARLPLTDGSYAELRASRVGHPKDPQRGRAALLALEAAHVTLVPRPLRAGTTAGAAWATETVLPGRHATKLTSDLLDEITRHLAGLPAAPTPPSAADDQLHEVATAFPDQTEALNAVAAAVRRWTGDGPSVLTHGDMWLNNVLVADGHLSGVFDWDGWHPAGVPGTDLLNLLAAEERTRSRRDIGPLLISDYWRSAGVVESLRRYMVARGIAMPDAAGLAATGVAWWASRIAGSLDRGKRPTEDPAWVERNLVQPLDYLEHVEREFG